MFKKGFAVVLGMAFVLALMRRLCLRQTQAMIT